jgi:PmbA protein
MPSADQTRLLEIAESAVRHARRLGADAADAVIVEALSRSVDVRQGAVEDVESAEGRDLGLRVFVGDRQAIVSTNDFTEATLSALAERAVAMARVVPPDPFAGLADAAYLARSFPELDLFDATVPDNAVLERLAVEAEEAALAVNGVTNAGGASAGYSVSGMALVSSHGFAGSYRRSGYAVSVSAIAGTGTDMQRDYDSTSAVHFGDLRTPAEIGRSAGERAVARLDPRKVESRKGPVVFDPRMSRSLIGHLLGAINGSAIVRGTSFLIDSLGQQVLPTGFTVTDDPLKIRGQRSRPFDGEGLACTRQELVADGILTTWILDTRSARKLGMAPTGHASRGISSPPSPSVTNVTLAPGRVSRAELIADIDQGLLVTELLGQGANLVTGDYSRGAAGFWIENGEIAYPVAEITIAGNLKDMFRNMSLADDIEYRGGIDTPSIRVEGMTIAGR